MKLCMALMGPGPAAGGGTGAVLGLLLQNRGRGGASQAEARDKHIFRGGNDAESKPGQLPTGPEGVFYARS